MTFEQPMQEPVAALPRWAAVAIVCALTIAYAAGYAWSAPNTDTADELWHAYEIRHALAYPLEGPFLGQAIHLGPAWFYLVALPLGFTSDWLWVAVFMGLVCAMKFPLAYHCGRVLLDREFGVLWAIAMFIPGWSTIEMLVFLNPNAVAAATLAVLALCLRYWKRPMGFGSFAILGLAFALAIHVHPTSLPIAVPIIALAWLHRRGGGSLLEASGGLAAGFVVPFVPYAIHELTSGFPDWSSASHYAASQVSLANIVHMPAVLWAYAFGGPQTVALYLLKWPGVVSSAAGYVTAVAAFASLLALLFPGRPRLLLAGFAGTLLAFTAWIAIARPTTPVQFTWILTPIFGGLIALGLWSISRLRLRPRRLVAAFVIASVAFNLWVTRAMARAVDEGEGVLPSTILDVKGTAGGPPTRDIWFPARAHAALGEWLCASKGPTSLHGHLAFVFDRDLGLDTLLACGRRAEYVLAADAPANYFAMTRPFWGTLDWRPDCRIGSIGFAANPISIKARTGLPVADGSHYLPRAAGTHPLQVVTLTLDAPANAAVLVTNVVGAFEYFRVASAKAEGTERTPLAGNDLSQLYGPVESSAREITWTIAVESTNADALDMTAFVKPTGQSPCPG